MRQVHRGRLAFLCGCGARGGAGRGQVGARSLLRRAAGYGLLLLVLLAAGCQKEQQTEDPPDLEKMAQSLQTNYFSPEETGVYIDHAFWVDEERSRKTTVRETLLALGAYRRDGKVYDAQGKELYFYDVKDSPALPRKPPRQDTKKEIRELSKKYHVIRMYGRPPKD
jgi:hypothetical protein